MTLDMGKDDGYADDEYDDLIDDDAIEGEIVDDDDEPTEFDDLPEGDDTAAEVVDDDGPLVPEWLRSWSAFNAEMNRRNDVVVRKVKRQTPMVPIYLGRLLARVPMGLWRCMSWTYLWVLDAETRHTRAALGDLAMPDSGQAASLVRLTQERRETLRIRLGTAAAFAIAGAVLVFGVVPRQEGWHQLVFWAGAIAYLGWRGHDIDHPIVWHGEDAGDGPRLTQDLIVDALAVLGLPDLKNAIREDRHSVQFTGPVMRDGNGWRAVFDVPGGVTAGEVISKRDKLASALRRPENCVWPEPDKRHSGRVVLWVADHPLSETPPTPWPLLRAGKVNVFRPIPFGTDQRGNKIDVTLIDNSILMGAASGGGKTAVIRTLVLTCALDPRVEINVHNLKGGNDLACVKSVARYYRAGSSDDRIEEMMKMLRYAVADMQRRYDVIEELPVERCPEGEVTDELSSDKSLGLHPMLVVIDEIQFVMDHPDYKKEAEKLMTDLSKRARAAGIIPCLATQRPDGDSIKPGIKSNAALRWCGRVDTHLEVDMVLGTGAHKRGYQSNQIDRNDQGVGYLKGEKAAPVLVRAYYVNNLQAVPVAARARHLRERAGTLSGMAIGEELDVNLPTIDNIADMLAVFVGDAMHLGALAEALAEMDDRPGYAALDAGRVGGMLRAAKIEPKNLRVGGSKPARGVRRDQLHVVHDGVLSLVK